MHLRRNFFPVNPQRIISTMRKLLSGPFRKLRRLQRGKMIALESKSRLLWNSYNKVSDVKIQDKADRSGYDRFIQTTVDADAADETSSIRKQLSGSGRFNLQWTKPPKDDAFSLGLHSLFRFTARASYVLRRFPQFHTRSQSIGNQECDSGHIRSVCLWAERLH